MDRILPMSSTSVHKSIGSSFFHYHLTLLTLHNCLILVVSNPTKLNHSEAIDATMRTGVPEFSKLDFLASLTTIRAKIFNKSTILSAFKNSGLIPYNPEIILQKFRPANSQTPLS